MRFNRTVSLAMMWRIEEYVRQRKTAKQIAELVGLPHEEVVEVLKRNNLVAARGDDE